jgi:hypothetical protein
MQYRRQCWSILACSKSLSQKWCPISAAPTINWLVTVELYQMSVLLVAYQKSGHRMLPAAWIQADPRCLQSRQTYFSTGYTRHTWRQWLYRNARIYLRKFDGMTIDEHLAVINLVKDMMLVDPADLLPCHCSLLFLKWARVVVLTASCGYQDALGHHHLPRPSGPSAIAPNHLHIYNWPLSITNDTGRTLGF